MGGDKFRSAEISFERSEVLGDEGYGLDRTGRLSRYGEDWSGR